MAKKTITLGLLLLLAAVSGCATPQVLIAQGFAGDRVVRYTIQQGGESTSDSGALFNLRVRICNQGDDGSDQNCQDTLVLENVQPRSVY